MFLCPHVFSYISTHSTYNQHTTYIQSRYTLHTVDWANQIIGAFQSKANLEALRDDLYGPGPGKEHYFDDKAMLRWWIAQVHSYWQPRKLCHEILRKLDQNVYAVLAGLSLSLSLFFSLSQFLISNAQGTVLCLL